MRTHLPGRRLLFEGSIQSQKYGNWYSKIKAYDPREAPKLSPFIIGGSVIYPSCPITVNNSLTGLISIFMQMAVTLELLSNMHNCILVCSSGSSIEDHYLQWVAKCWCGYNWSSSTWIKLYLYKQYPHAYLCNKSLKYKKNACKEWEIDICKVFCIIALLHKITFMQ